MKRRAFVLGLLALTIGACAVFIPYRVGPASDVRVEITPEQVALGKKLAEGIMACGACHTTGSFEGDPQQNMYLAGDVFISEMEGVIAVPNITPDKETGIGAWTDGEIIRAITKGLSRDNRVLLPAMPWANFGAVLTGEEARALVAYLRTVPEPINHKPAETDLTLFMTVGASTGMIYNMFAKEPFYTEYEPSSETAVERGKRLAYLGACVDCPAYAPKTMPKFGEPLAGGLGLDVPGRPPVLCANLTPDVATGIGGFSDQQVFESIKFGKRLRPRPDTEMVRWPMIARIPHHVALTDEEIGDLIAFFRSQPAIEHDIVGKMAELDAEAGR